MVRKVVSDDLDICWVAWAVLRARLLQSLLVASLPVAGSCEQAQSCVALGLDRVSLRDISHQD